jgi:hypothetical protein
MSLSFPRQAALFNRSLLTIASPAPGRVVGARSTLSYTSPSFKVETGKGLTGKVTRT